MDTFFNDVNDWLSVGGDLDLAEVMTGQDYATTIKQLFDHGVTHVLDVRSEWQDRRTWSDNGLPVGYYAHVPIIDSWNHRPDEGWYAGVTTFVKRFLENRMPGDRLYCHCHMGINRGPSAAMVALLTENSSLAPEDAFLAIREARDAAGLVYAESIGIRHISHNTRNRDDDHGYRTMSNFRKFMQDYWTGDRITQVNRGIAYYRDVEGGTVVV